MIFYLQMYRSHVHLRSLELALPREFPSSSQLRAGTDLLLIVVIDIELMKFSLHVVDGFSIY